MFLSRINTIVYLVQLEFAPVIVASSARASQSSVEADMRKWQMVFVILIVGLLFQVSGHADESAGSVNVFVINDDDVNAVSVEKNGELRLQLTEAASGKFEEFTRERVGELVTVNWGGELLNRVIVRDVFKTRSMIASRPYPDLSEKVQRFLESID